MRGVFAGHAYEGGGLQVIHMLRHIARVRADTASPALDARFRDLDRQDNGEVDIDVSNAPMQAQVSNMDVSVSVGRTNRKAVR